MTAQPQAAIRRSNDVLAPDEPHESLNALRDELRVLDQGRRMRHDAGSQDLALRELYALPNCVLVLVSRVGGFEEVSLRFDGEHDVDHVGQGDVVRVRTVPAAPTKV